MEQIDPSFPPDITAVPEPVISKPVDLQVENEQLRNQLKQVVATASLNEGIWRHFAEIERILFRTRQLDVLIEELLREIKERFKIDQVVLFLSDPDVLESFFPHISAASDPIGEGTWILPLSPEAGVSLYGDPPRPFVLSPEDIDILPDFLPEEVSNLGSGVIIPLCVHQIVFGCLFLGSGDATRYRPSDGTELLEHLGIKIALCMDNCLAYEKVKDFTLKDPLTGLFNFFQIHTVLEREIRKARRLKTSLSILIVDFSFFHNPDDHLDQGNEILKHASGILSEILTREESYIGRYGSDEFLVVLPNVNNDEVREVIPYLHQTIRKSPFKSGKAAILIQTNIGVGAFKNGMRSQDILDEAYGELRRLKMVQSERSREE